MATVTGTNNSDLLDALDGVTNGADSIFGPGGNDIIRSRLGANSLFGGDDIDTASYVDSAVAVQVNLLTDVATGGWAEGDVFDSIENVTGSAHDDFLVGNGFDNVLRGLQDNDNLKGGGGDDRLEGGSGNDMLKGGGGEDTLNGDGGIDTVAYNESDEGVSVSLSVGLGDGGHDEIDELNSIENVIGSDHGDQLYGNGYANVLRGLKGNDELVGGDGSDTLLGEDNNDELFGQTGADTLSGGNGQDILDGGTGDDTMTGGAGGDRYTVDSQGDTVIEAVSSGSDAVWAKVSYVLAAAADVETLRTNNINDTAAINLTGNGQENYLIGNDGMNSLDGGASVDTMQGEGGNDTYYVDNAGDAVLETVDSGADVVRAALSYQLTAGSWVEALTAVNGASTAPQTLIGNDHTQTIVGNAGLSVLRGLGGNDQLQGMAGNDTLTGGAGGDKFLFNTALNAATNVDTVTDMTAGVDTIRLDDAHFAGIGRCGRAERRCLPHRCGGCRRRGSHCLQQRHR